MGRIGTGELVLILIIALVIFGPAKLPELGRSVGKTLNEFKKASKEFQEDLSIDSTPKKAAKAEKVEEAPSEAETEAEE